MAAFEGWVLDIGGKPEVVAHFTASSADMFEKVVDSYRRGYPEDTHVIVSETPLSETRASASEAAQRGLSEA